MNATSSGALAADRIASVGWVGFGDPGAPMARAIVDADFA